MPWTLWRWLGPGAHPYRRSHRLAVRQRARVGCQAPPQTLRACLPRWPRVRGQLQTIPLALRSDHAVAKKRRNTSTLLAKAPFEKHFKAAGQSVEARQADTDTYRQCLTSRGGDCNCHRPSLPRPAPLATVLWSLHRWLQKKRSRVKALALSSSNMQQPQYACCAAAESVKRAASATPHCCGELWSGR